MNEGFESGTLGIFSSSGSPGWNAVTGDPHSGSYSAFAPDVSNVSDQRLVTTNPIFVTYYANYSVATFWHKYSFDADGTAAFRVLT